MSSIIDDERPAATPAVRSAPLRVGIVGCGAVAERYHLPALLASPHARLTMLADPVGERAQRLGALVPEAFATDDHLALIGAVDLAIVAAPNHVHASIAGDLLRAGIHVLIEKPMATTVDDCNRICEAAVLGGAVVAVGHDFRFFPVAQAAHQILAQRLLGRIMRADVRQSAGVRWPCLSPSALSAASGGGVLMDFGVHLLDLLSWWLGDLRVVSYQDDAAGGVEAECWAELAMDDGTRVSLEVTRRRASRDTTIVECEKGTLEIGIFEPAMLRMTLASGVVLDVRAPDAAFERAPLTTVFARQLADVVRAIDDRGAPLVTGAAGRRAVTLVERCYGQRRPLRWPWDYPEVYAALGRGSKP